MLGKSAQAEIDKASMRHYFSIIANSITSRIQNFTSRYKNKLWLDL